MMAVGSVGENLAAYTFVPPVSSCFQLGPDLVLRCCRDSDTFLTRDAGFTWEEVHKDAHMWEFGDYGSILVLAKYVVLVPSLRSCANEPSFELNQRRGSDGSRSLHDR